MGYHQRFVIRQKFRQVVLLFFLRKAYILETIVISYALSKQPTASFHHIIQPSFESI